MSYKKIKLFCVTDKPLPSLEDSCLNLVGVGKELFNNKYLDCSKKENIYYKEKNYSELTFHYWYWKNLLQNEDAEWVGFCQKRRFWIKSSSINKNITSENLVDHLLVEPENDWRKFDSMLCSPINVTGAKKIKILKRGWRNIIFNPGLIFKKNSETIKIHFDMHHGHKNLEKAIKVLNNKDKNEFNDFVNIQKTYNPHIMFITKSEIANEWFKDLFEWLFRCEEIFGFENLKGYDTMRIYAYLAERYLSFWFQKHTKFKNSPWVFINH